MKAFSICLSAAILTLAQPILAQDAESEELDQDLIADCFDYCGPLVVEGQRARIASALGFEHSLVLSSDTGIENALRNIPGLQQFRRTDSRSANPSGQGITMRGLGGNASSRALVTLDGVPQMDPFGGWVSWTGLDTTAAASAVVSSGGGFVHAGPGAVAGIVDLNSVRANFGSTGNRFGFDIQGGSFGSANVRTDGLVDIGGVIAQFSGAVERSDGFAPIIAAQRGSVDGRAAYRNKGGAMRFLRALSDGVELQANIRSWSDRRNRGTAISENSNDGTDASLRIVGAGSVDWSLLGYFQDRGFSSQFASISADRRTIAPVLDQYAVPAQGWGLGGSMGFDVSNNTSLSLGADFRHMDGETRENFFFTGIVPGRNRIAGGNNETLGGFAEVRNESVNRLKLSLSGRVDRWSIADGFRREINIGGNVRSDDRFTDRNGTEPTGRAAFDWQFRQTSGIGSAHLKGSLFTSWRLPTLNELYRPFRVGSDATAANELLSPERVKGGEIGLVWSEGGYNLKVTAFASKLEKAIANVTLGQGPGNFPGIGFVAAGGAYRKRQNLDAIESNGIEIAADGWLTGNLRFEAGYALIDARVRASGTAAALNGLRPAQVARHNGRFALLFDARAGRSTEASHAFIGSGVTVRYYGSQFEDDSNRQRLNHAVTADAELRYSLAKGIAVRLAAENLFDTQVQAAISSAGIIERATPRTLWLGLSFDIE